MAEQSSVDIRDTPDLVRVAEEVRQTKQPRTVDIGHGVIAVIKPASTRVRKRAHRPKTEADMAAFRASFGSWKDVDTDKLLEDIYESRRLSTRPPVEL